MSDFTINIDSKLDLSNAETKIKDFIKTYSNNPLQIKVELDTKSINTSNLGKQMQNSFSNAGKNAGKAYNTALQNQIDTMVKTQRTAFSEPLKNMSKYEKSYSDMWNRLMSKAPSTYGKNQQQIAFDEYSAQLKQMEQKASEIKKRVSQKFLDVESSGVKKVLTKYSGNNSQEYKALESSYSKLISLQKELKTGISDDGLGRTLSDKSIVSKYQQFYEVLTKCKNEMKVLSNESISFSKPFSRLDASTASNRTLTWLKNNSKAAKEYGNRLREVAELQKTASNQDELKMYTKQANDLISEAKSKGLTGKSGVESIKNTIKTAGRFVSVYSVLNKIPHVVGQIANEVIKVDSAMTELRKVSSDSEDLQITNYFERATESAKKYGAQISEVINSAADWKRLGYSVADATKLADTTTLLEKVGDNMTQESASSGLISTLKGFQKTADEAQKIADSINAVANTQPIDTAGLFAGLERSASSMNAANNSLEQTIGLITAANSVVQNPDSVGTAFKTKFIRNCLYVQKCA